MRTSLLRSFAACIVSGIVLVASSAAATPALPPIPRVKLVEPGAKDERATQHPKTFAEEVEGPKKATRTKPRPPARKKIIRTLL